MTRGEVGGDGGDRGDGGGDAGDVVTDAQPTSAQQVPPNAGRDPRWRRHRRWRYGGGDGDGDGGRDARRDGSGDEGGGGGDDDGEGDATEETAPTEKGEGDGDAKDWGGGVAWRVGGTRRGSCDHAGLEWPADVTTQATELAATEETRRGGEWRAVEPIHLEKPRERVPRTTHSSAICPDGILCRVSVRVHGRADVQALGSFISHAAHLFRATAARPTRARPSSRPRVRSGSRPLLISPGVAATRMPGAHGGNHEDGLRGRRLRRGDDDVGFTAAAAATSGVDALWMAAAPHRRAPAATERPLGPARTGTGPETA